MTGWERLGIGGLSQGFLSGRLSPSAALDDALAGIAAIDDDLSAFVAIDADGATTYGSHALAGAVASADAEVIRRHPRQRPSHYLGYLRGASLVLTGNENAIQRDPNEVIIGM